MEASSSLENPLNLTANFSTLVGFKQTMHDSNDAEAAL